MSAAKLSAEEIAGQLCVFLRENVLAPNIEVTVDTELTDIGVDSFSLMELVLFIERQFGLELPAESLSPENIASVATLSAYCVKSLNSTTV
jgi:acyl carrier protein